MKVGLNRFADHVNSYFQEYIELIPASMSIIFGIVTALPAATAVSSTYDSNLARLIFGLLIMSPGVLVFYNLAKNGMKKYSLLKRATRYKLMFYMTITFIYVGALSAGVTIYPPRWLLFIGMGVISLLCYLRLNKK